MDVLIDFIREQEAELAAKSSSAKDILFVNYMKQWLERVKMRFRLTTYSGYQDYVNGVIVPYFEPLGLKLNEVAPQHIQNFYTEQ